MNLSPEMIRSLATAFPLLSDGTTSWGKVVNNHLLLRHLRAYWPFTSVDENGDVYDLSGQGRVLTNNNTIPFASASLMTYADFTPASLHYFSRLDEAGLDITGALTVGGWFWLDTLAPATANMALISKWDSAGGLNNRAYMLFFDNATNTFRFGISQLGTAASTLIIASTAVLAINTWYHVVGKFIPGVRQSIFVNGVETAVIVGVPAAIFNSPAPLMVGDFSASAYLDGRASHCVLCADALEDYFIKALFWHSAPLVGVKP